MTRDEPNVDHLALVLWQSTGVKGAYSSWWALSDEDKDYYRGYAETIIEYLREEEKDRGAKSPKGDNIEEVVTIWLNI